MRTKLEQNIVRFRKENPDKTLLYAIQTGSHLFDLNVASSDLDMVGIYLPSPKEFKTKKFDKEFAYDSNKTNTKNNKDDVDCKFINIFTYIDHLKKGEFNSLEWLYAPDKVVLYKDKIWDEYFSNKESMTVFNLSSFLGFIKKEYRKAGLSGHVINQLKETLTILHTFDKTLCLDQATEKLKQLDFITFGQVIVDNKHKNVLIDAIKVGERTFQNTCRINYVIEELEYIIKSNEVSHRKDNQGVDHKGLYHASRLLVEAKHLLTTGTLRIPFSEEDHKYLMSIRTKEIDLETLKDNIEKSILEIRTLEKSDLAQSFVKASVSHSNYLDKIKDVVFNRFNILAKTK